MRPGHIWYVLLIIGSTCFPTISPIEAQTAEILIQDVQLEFYDNDSDTYNDTVRISFFIDFTLPITDNYIVDIGLLNPLVAGYYAHEILTLNTQDNISNYNSYFFTISEENTYYITLLCEYELSKDYWESSEIHFDGYMQQTPRFAGVIYDLTNGDGDESPDGIDFTYNFVSPFSGITNVTVNTLFFNDQGNTIFTRTLDYSFNEITGLNTNNVGRAPSDGNYSARIDLYWNSWKRDTYSTLLHILDRFYDLTTLSSPSFTIELNPGPNSYASSINCQFSATVSEDIEVFFSTSVIKVGGRYSDAYEGTSIYLQNSNTNTYTLYFSDHIFDRGWYYALLDIDYMGFTLYSKISYLFFLDGPDLEIDIEFQSMMFDPSDSDGDGFDDTLNLSFFIFTDTTVSITVELWIWSQGDIFFNRTTYTLDLEPGISEQQFAVFGSLPFESNYYVDLWIYYRSFPEVFEQKFGWYLYELNHSEPITSVTPIETSSNGTTTDESSGKVVSVLKISFLFSPPLLPLFAYVFKKHRIINPNNKINMKP